jgi:hypothetical protein
MDRDKFDDQITLTPNKGGEKEASKGKEVTLMDKTKEANDRKDLHNPTDIKLEH